MADYSKEPTVEDMLGAGFKFDEATSVLKFARNEPWTNERLWAFVLKHSEKTWPRFDKPGLSAYLKKVTGKDQLADIE